jgi:hypothetical protein
MGPVSHTQYQEHGVGGEAGQRCSMAINVGQGKAQEDTKDESVANELN